MAFIHEILDKNSCNEIRSIFRATATCQIIDREKNITLWCLNRGADLDQPFEKRLNHFTMKLEDEFINFEAYIKTENSYEIFNITHINIPLKLKNKAMNVQKIIEEALLTYAEGQYKNPVNIKVIFTEIVGIRGSTPHLFLKWSECVT